MSPENAMNTTKLSDGAVVASFAVGAALALYAHQFGAGPALVAVLGGALATTALAVFRLALTRIDLRAMLLSLLERDQEASY